MNEITYETQPLPPQLNAPAPDFHATPADWQLVDKVIIPPPATVDAAKSRMKEGYECTDWYFCEKELSIEQVQQSANKQLQKA